MSIVNCGYPVFRSLEKEFYETRKDNMRHEWGRLKISDSGVTKYENLPAQKGKITAPGMSNSSPYNSRDDDISDDDENGGDSKSQYIIADVIALIKQNHYGLSNELKSFKKELSSLHESTQFVSNSSDELQKENMEIKRPLEEESGDLHNAKKRIRTDRKTEEMVSSIIGHIGVSMATLEFKARRISQAANSPVLLELNKY
ncbi:hypothetical protein HHI36_004837 [Cryptolaemus montrouzieri]|uniref:Uncharacterized protein n=1 Tax=Cryptolaemus montrouzieri TaxID=559131 RepID=A0ABD2NSE0_9CUCU